MTHAWRKAAIALLTMVLIVALAAPAMAAKKKSRKSDDPMKGRISIGGTVGGGGGTGETLAFVAQLSLTYWFNKYL
ncbi:hypothetical protein KDL45_18465, partial [bacterium]|nr:hypothetical protein [bacterium]